MGDRTWVEIVVLKECLPQVTEEDELAVLYFDEVDYGCIDEQDKLTNSGIPYNYEWGIDDSYDAGSKYIRFTPEGELVHIEYYESEYNPPFRKAT